MAGDKKIVIGSSFDQKGVDAAIKSLKNLQKEGLKIGQILKGLDLSTGAGRGRFSKSIIETERQMGRLRGTTQDTAKVLGNVYGKQLEAESKRLDRLTGQLTKLNKLRKEQQVAYENAAKAGATETDLRRRREVMSRTDDSIVVREGSRRVAQAHYNDLGAPPPGAPKLSTQDKLLITQAAANAIGGIAGAIQDSKNLGWRNQAAAGGFAGDAVRQFLGGNFSLADAWVNGRRDVDGTLKRGAGLYSEAGGRNATRIGIGANAVSAGAQAGSAGLALTAKGAAAAATGGATLEAGEALDAAGVAKGVSIGHNMSQIGDAAAKGYRAYADATKGTAAGIEAGNLREMSSLAVQVNPHRQIVYEQLAQTAASRLAASRRLGGNHMDMAGLGAGFGLDPFGEALPMATSLAEQFGATAVTGKSGIMKHALELERFGLDRNKSGMILGTLGMANGGTQQARKDLEEIFSRGIARGLSPQNVQFFEAIGTAVASKAFGAQGAISGASQLGQALSFGASDMHGIQRNIGGLQALENINQNGYFRATSLENAKKQLGPGADYAMVQALGGAEISDLAGNGSQQLRDLGVSPAAIRAQRESRLNTYMNSVISKDSTGTNAKKLLAAQSAAGGSWAKALLNDDVKGVASSYLPTTPTGSAMGAGREGVLGALNILAGLDVTKGGGKMPTPIGDPNALSQKTAVGMGQMSLANDEKKVITPDVFDAAKLFVENFSNFKPGLNAATDALDGLEKILDVLQKIAGVAPTAADNIAKEQLNKATSADRIQSRATVFRPH